MQPELDTPRLDTIVIGGGIAGLTVAYDLARAGRRVQVIEARERLGGLVHTDRLPAVSLTGASLPDGEGGTYIIETGADALLVQKPAASDLCAELGLPLVPTRAPRTAFVLRDGHLHPISSDSTLGIPLTPQAIAESTMLSEEGRARVASELVEPREKEKPDEDESIGAFVRRRFGEEAVRYLAQPLLGGIHAGDVERLSLRALFPALADADAQPGSLLRTLQARRREPSPDGAFTSIPGGLGHLVDALAARLPAGAVRLGDPVRRLARRPVTGSAADANSGAAVDASRPATAWVVELASGIQLRAPSIVLAIPAYVAADLIAPLEPIIAERCREIPYVSSASLTLCYPRTAISHPLAGTGIVIPRGEQTRLMAVSWVTSKWDGRAPADQIMIRAFAGGAGDEELVDEDDEALVSMAHGDLVGLLGIAQRPIFSKVYRWRRAGPQYEVGHEARVAAIEARLETLPGLFMTGCAFRGVGIPDNVADGRRTAALVETWLTGAPPRPAAKMGDA